MIDFRYHLVSIVAVFLALAIGIVVGAEALSPQLANQLNKESQQVSKRNMALYAENSQLKQELAVDNAFGQAASGQLLNQLLRGHAVALVTAPGADAAAVTGMTKALTSAGAKITGRISLTPQFFDTSATTETTLTTLASQLTPTGASFSSRPSDAQIAGQEQAGELIAAAIMSKDGQPLVTTSESKAILAGLGQHGYLQVSGPQGSANLSGPADLAVVVIPATVPSPANASSPENLALVTLADEMRLAGTTALLAGTVQGSGTGSAIDAVTSGSAGVSVTTVDDADTSIGQIIMVQALWLGLGPHPKPASYGVATGVAPSPAPSASPSPAASTSAAQRATTGKKAAG